MTQYTPITFAKLSEAISYLEDGGKLYQFDCGHMYDVTVTALASGCWKETLQTEAPPAKWYEKLDGTVDNGVLCWTDSERDDITIITAYKPGEYFEFKAAYNRSEDGFDGFDELTPLTRAEIQKFMDNAPEEV